MEMKSIYQRSKKILSELTQLNVLGNYVNEIDATLRSIPKETPFLNSSSIDQDLGPLYINATPYNLIFGYADPVSILWTLARTGFPLCTILNYLMDSNKAVDLRPFQEAIHTQNIMQCQSQAYFFIMTCRKVLKFQEVDFIFNQRVI